MEIACLEIVSSETQPNIGSQEDSPSTNCWVCNSENSRLVVGPGYGVVRECLDCSNRVPNGGAIQWVI